MATHLEFKRNFKAEKNINISDIESGSVTAFISRASEAICSESAMQALEAVECRARTMQGVAQAEPPEKRARKEQTGAFPSDINSILMIVQRLLETINYASFLGDNAWPAASLPQGLEDALWRWSAAADIFAPKIQLPTWKEEAWTWLAQMLRQMINTDRPVYESLNLVQKLLKNVDDEEPEEEQIKTTLSHLFARLQYTPQLKAVLDDMKCPAKSLGKAGENSDSVPDRDEESPVEWNCHPRVAQSIEALLQSGTFRGLSGDTAKPDSRANSTPSKSKDGVEEPEQTSATTATRGALDDKTNVVQGDDEMRGNGTEPVKTPKSFRVISNSLEGEEDGQDDAEMAMASVGLMMKSTPQSGKRLHRKTQVYVDPLESM
jgi:hypothetical protein